MLSVAVETQQHISPMVPGDKSAERSEPKDFDSGTIDGTKAYRIRTSEYEEPAALPPAAVFRITPVRRGVVILVRIRKVFNMRRIKPAPIRNKIDLADARQVRLFKKRLGISIDDLQRLVGKVGNSIAAISKEVELQKACPPLRETMPVLSTSMSTTEISATTAP
jgi:hypothetical protein